LIRQPNKYPVLPGQVIYPATDLDGFSQNVLAFNGARIDTGQGRVFAAVRRAHSLRTVAETKRQLGN